MTRTDVIARAIDLAEVDNHRNWDELDDLWLKLKAEYKHIGFNSIGDSVGPGWWLPLLEAFDIIEAIMVNEPEYRFNVRQIKEKFGGLRFYWSLEHVNAGGDEEVAEDAHRTELAYSISQLTQVAEDKCEKRCETCGEPGELRSSGWLKILCDKHARKRK